MPAQAFVETITRVARSASRDETRPVLTGILVSAAGQRAADGRDRLLPPERQGDDARGSRWRRPSRRTCRRVRCEELARHRQRRRPRRSPSACAQTRWSSSVGEIALSSRLIDGQFPNYRQLLPETFEHELTMSTDELLTVARRIACWRRRTRRCGSRSPRASCASRRRRRTSARPARRCRCRSRASRSRSASTRSSCVAGLESVGCAGRRAEAHQPAAPGPDRVGRRQRLPVPHHAHPPERLMPQSSVVCVCATSAPTTARTSASGRGPDGRPRPQRRGQDEPARGALLRLHGALVPDRATTARSSASARRRPAWRPRCVAADGAHELASATRPGDAQAPDRRRRAGRAAARRARSARWSPSSCPTGSSWSRARPRCAGRISTRSSPRSGRRAPSTRRAYARALAQRNALLPRVRSGAVIARARCAPGTSRSAVTRSRCAPTARGRRARVAPGARGARRTTSGSTGGTELRYRPRSKADDGGGVRRRARRAPARRPRARLHRPRPAPRRARAAPRRPRAARLRLAGRAAPRRCSRCCSPSARRCSAERGDPPLLLLDDVMSELDADRRERLVERVTAAGRGRDRTTDLAHVPGAGAPGDVAARLARREDGQRAPGGAGRMSRRRSPAPRSAVRRSRGARRAASLPATTLGAVQGVWAQAAGAAVAAEATPTGELDGVLTVTCSSAVWAQELDLMSATLIDRLNARARGRARSARCAARPCPRAGWSRDPADGFRRIAATSRKSGRFAGFSAFAMACPGARALL